MNDESPPAFRLLKKKLTDVTHKSLEIPDVQDYLASKWKESEGAYFTFTQWATGKSRAFPAKLRRAQTLFVKCFEPWPDSQQRRTKKLRSAPWHPKLFLIAPLSIPVSHCVPELVDEIAELRTQILTESKSTIKAVLSGKIGAFSRWVDPADLKQWAALSAWEAILNFDTKQKSWDKYLIHTLNRSLYKRIIEEPSRPLMIPRWVLSRWVPIKRAMDEGYIEYDDIADRATELADSAMAKFRPYTAAEVERLIISVTSSQSVEVTEDSASMEHEDTVDAQRVSVELSNVVSKLSPEDRFIVELRLQGHSSSEIQKLWKEKFKTAGVRLAEVRAMENLKALATGSRLEKLWAELEDVS